MSKYVKTVDIARSGIYTYGKDEVFALQAGPIPAHFADRTYFNIYRPASVIELAADMFTRLPVTVEHPSENVGPFNAHGLMTGLSGDQAELIYHDGEIYIRSSLTLIAADVIQYYEHGYVEVSPGYTATSVWLPEEKEYNGVKYQLIMVEIKSVNHLALTVKARGGETTRIIDSKGGHNMKSGLVLWAKRLLCKDSKGQTARELLSSVTPENVVTVVDSVMSMTEDFPDCGNKDKLVRFLADLKHASVLDSMQLKAAADKTADLYDSLDAEVMKEVNEVKVEEKTVTDNNPGTTAAAGPGTSTVKEENANPETPALGDSKDEEKKEEPVKDSVVLQSINDSMQSLLAGMNKLTELLTPKEIATETVVSVKDSVSADPTMTLDSGATGKGIDDFMATTFGKK